MKSVAVNASSESPKYANNPFLLWVSPINETNRLSEKKAETRLVNKKIAIDINMILTSFEIQIGIFFSELNNFPMNKLEINKSATNFGVLKGSIEFVLINKVMADTPRTKSVIVFDESLLIISLLTFTS